MTTALAVARKLDELERKRDPLKHFKCSSWAQERLFRDCAKAEIYWHAGNSGGKTTGGATLAVGLARGVSEIDGIPLPRLQQPTSGVLIVPSYKVAAGSSYPAYLAALGGVEHHADYSSGSNGCPGMLYIRYDRCQSDDFRNWSKVYIFPRDGEVPEGLRLDFAHGDEPPDGQVWEAVRFRGKAGRPYIRFITATPIEKRYWSWMMEEAEFRDRLGEVGKGKLRMQSSIFDNRALSQADYDRAEQDAESSVYKKARIMGDHVDASGMCPWPYELLAKWKSRCLEPNLERIVIQTEQDGANGRQKVEVAVTAEFYADYDPHDVYLGVADPSSGSEGPGHDPAGLHIWSRRRRALVARFNGYLSAYGLGMLAASLGKRYGNALLDVETTGGWAGPFLTALREAKYGHISRERYEDRPGVWAHRLGWSTNKDSRALIIGAVEEALLKDDAGIWSAGVVDTLMNCVLDEKGKILAMPGYHDEDLICAGRALYVIRSRPASPERVNPEPSSSSVLAEVINREMGRKVIVPRRRHVATERWG